MSQHSQFADLMDDETLDEAELKAFQARTRLFHIALALAAVCLIGFSVALVVL